MTLRSDVTPQIVGVGDCLMSKRGGIITHALGSCLGLAVWDSSLRIGGLLHAMLPFSKINPEKAALNPAMFVDTGVPALLRALLASGARKSNLVIKGAGCANPLASGNMFRVGIRNLEVLECIMAKNGLRLHGAEIGGTISRTMRFDVSTGRVSISSGSRKWEL